MGIVMRLLKKLIKLIIYFLVFAAIIVLIPNLPPYTSFTKLSLELPQPLTGVLAPNGALDNAEKLYVDKLLGPEAFQLYKGEVYTSLATGEIVKLSPGGHVTFVTKIGQPCSGILHEHICGRPLGFTFDERNNQMYVADAYHGIWKVDLKTDKKQLLVSPNVEIEGRVPKLFNSVALDGQGNLYWTDSSSDFQLKDGVFSMLTDPSGRLFQYNAVKNTSTVLMDKLWFANGVAVSPDNQFLVVAETFGNKLHKYYINGKNKGKSEVFVSGLPGAPDNVRSLPDGSGLLVGLPVAHEEGTPDLTRSLAAAPYARKFLARILKLIEIPFEFLNKHYPHFLFEDIVYKVGHFDMLATLMPHPSGLLQIDWNGNIIASYFNKDRSVIFISDGIVYNDKLFLGRPHGQNFIGSVPAPALLKKAFAVKAVPEKKEIPQTEKPVASKQQAKVAEKEPKGTAESKPKVEAAKPTPQPLKPTPQTDKPTPAPAKQSPPPAKPTPQPPKATQQSSTTPQPSKTAPSAQATKPTVAPQEKQDASKQELPKAQTIPTQRTKSPGNDKTTLKPSEKVNVATDSTTQKPKTDMPKTSSDTAQLKATIEKPKPAQQKSQSEIPKSNYKAPPQQIPIKEDIPSDTVKPNKETLKVIKKEGPTEIPNPNL